MSHEPGFETTEVMATYDMEEDAIGLSAFIEKSVEAHIDEDQAPVVYVYDSTGDMVTKAVFERVTLTDGSEVFNLHLKVS